MEKMKYKVEVDFFDDSKVVKLVDLDDKELKNIFKCFNSRKNFYLQDADEIVLINLEYVTNIKVALISME